APGEVLRSIRDRHIRLRLHHHDFEGALPLLQSYVVDYHEHADAVRAAILLVDTLAMGWSTPDRNSNLGTSMLAWFDRLATLALWHDPAAAELHQRVAELRPGAMWRAAEAAREEGRNEWVALAEAGLPPRYEHAGFRRCAEQFMAILEAYPNHDRASTLLWNAAVCYEANYDIGRAYAARELLLARYPDSEHFQRVLLYQAETDHALARYDQAEDHYLEYALRYPKDQRSDDALLFAYQFGHALGHDTSDVVDEYVSRNARRDAERTGRFLWATRPAEPQRLLEFADEFLRSFRFKAGLTSREVLQVSAALHWTQACRGLLDDDLCVERRAAERTNQCSIGDVPMPKIRARERKQADEARSLMKAAAKYWETYDGRTAGDPAWRDRLAAESALLLLEPELEDYLLAGPNAPHARARAKQLDADYLEVAALGQVDVAIRAHARRGRIWELLASPGLRVHEGTCRPATAWAHGDRKRALAGYSQCLELAVAQLHFNDAARRCEAKLAGEVPKRVPPLVELFGEPGLLPSAIEPSGLQG
ncbi:MAG TPA: hypothetical protein VM869_34945, partial [Enhygromyxa sp.]|nr:hypothetical protein [Enhygromyxa sp.]